MRWESLISWFPVWKLTLREGWDLAQGQRPRRLWTWDMNAGISDLRELRFFISTQYNSDHIECGKENSMSWAIHYNPHTCPWWTRAGQSSRDKYFLSIWNAQSLVSTLVYRGVWGMPCRTPTPPISVLFAHSQTCLFGFQKPPPPPNPQGFECAF